MADLPTIEIVNPNSPSGFTRINVCDYDPAIHAPYKGKDDAEEFIVDDDGLTRVYVNGAPASIGFSSVSEAVNHYDQPANVADEPAKKRGRPKKV